MIGQIIISASDNVPDSYHRADGTWLKECEYFDLFNEIGTIYNQNNKKRLGMFQLPDCRGRVVIEMGTGDQHALKPRSIVLTEQQMPEHSHAGTVLGGSEGPASTGSNQPHENMQPFITMNVLIYIGEKTHPKCIICKHTDIWCQTVCCYSYYCKTCSINDKKCAKCEKYMTLFSLV